MHPRHDASAPGPPVDAVVADTSSQPDPASIGPVSAVVAPADVDRALRQHTAHLRHGTIPVNLAETALVLAILIAFAALPGHPRIHSAPFAVIVGVVAVGSIVLAAVVWHRPPDARGTLVLFFTWAVLDTAAISAIIAVSGGPRSDLYLAYMVLAVFQAGTAYPRPVRLLANVLSIVAYIATLAILGWHVGTATVVLRLGILAALAWGTDMLSVRTVADLRRQTELTLDSQRRARLWQKVAHRGSSLSSLDEPDIWDWVIDSVIELGYDAASICVVDYEHNRFTVAQSAGLPPEFADRSHPLDRAMVGEVLRTGTSRVVDYAELDHGDPSVRHRGIRTTIGTPVSVGSAISAVLVVGSRHRRRPGQEELAALELVASCAGHELTNARQYQDQRHQADWIGAILDRTPDAMVIFGPDRIIQHANHQATLLFGYEPHELIGMDVARIGRSVGSLQMPGSSAGGSDNHAPAKDPDASPWDPEHTAPLPPIGVAFPAVGTRKDGTTFPAEATLSTVETPDGVVIAVAGRDISERLALQKQLEHQALHDPLTGLPNRSALLHILAPLLDGTGTEHPQSDPDQPAVTICLLDIDHFKDLNGSRGHEVGDQLIVEVAHRLRSAAEAQPVARLGGDEFAVLNTTIATDVEAKTWSLHILDVLNRPFVVDGAECRISASAGIAFGFAGNNAVDVLRRADAAMYHAKQHSRGGVELHHRALTARARWRLDVSTALSGAIDRHELFLEYQPVVDLETSAVVGVEALLRWQRGSLLVGPDTFIPVAEDSGLIVPMGLWVLGEACRKASDWLRSPQQGQFDSININVSSRQLQHDQFVGDVAAMLDSTGIDPRAVVLEITESSFIEDLPAAVRRIEALRQLGVRIAIDDFGTGYSSLSSLSRLPVDEVKIDKSFVDGLGTRYDAIIGAVIEVADAFNLQVVAEGVERAEQVRRLHSLGCRFAQGFYFFRPQADATISRILGSTASGRP